MTKKQNHKAFKAESGGMDNMIPGDLQRLPDDSFFCFDSGDNLWKRQL